MYRSIVCGLAKYLLINTKNVLFGLPPCSYYKTFFDFIVLYGLSLSLCQLKLHGFFVFLCCAAAVQNTTLIHNKNGCLTDTSC